MSDAASSTQRIYHGDCIEVMATMDADSVDAIVTDPPYGLAFMGKDWDHAVPGVEFWAEALRVAKPGTHLVAFGGTRTFHRLACAIEDAGWEVRDCLSWLYGSGFPKSHNGPWGGTALKPAWEPIILARKPLAGTVAANVQSHGTGALNVDGCRVGTEQTITVRNGNSGGNGAYGCDERVFSRVNPPGRWPANVVLDEDAAAMLDRQTGTLISGKMRAGTQRKNLMGYHGAMPAETMRDTYGDTGGASRFFYVAKASRREREAGLEGVEPKRSGVEVFDPRNRDGVGEERMTLSRNHHPTVKPIALMRWLCRLVTPPGGLVLDPFTGSGTTGCAAVLEGFGFVGIEQDAEYVAIAERRIAHWGRR